MASLASLASLPAASSRTSGIALRARTLRCPGQCRPIRLETPSRLKSNVRTGHCAQITRTICAISGGSFQYFFPPQPVGFPRRQLGLKFAVLLMRSGYEAAEGMHFIAMTDFQIRFWKLRASEYESYLVQYSPIKVNQGKLDDPLYFDFISFAQYATLSQEMAAAKPVVQERDMEGNMTTITRPPELADNKLLPGAHFVRTGDRILDRLMNGFEGVAFGGPTVCGQPGSFECVITGVKRLMEIFAEQGYALRISVTDIVGSRSDATDQPASQLPANAVGAFRLRVQGPATLWGVRMLLSRRALVLPQFDAMAVSAFIRACGRRGTFVSEYSDTSIDTEWVVY
eukprot:jgi/Mesvir1/29680/Mv13037-RA.1